MVKCDICKERINELFLGKIEGTYIKKKAVCSSCQRRLRDKIFDEL